MSRTLVMIIFAAALSGETGDGSGNPPTDAIIWQSRPNRRLQTAQYPAGASDGRYFYVIGGFDGSARTLVRRYNPVGDTWEVRPSLDHAVYRAAACYAANYNSIFVFGGYGLGGSVRKHVQVMDCLSGNWNGDYDSLPYADCGGAAVALGDTIYYLSGEGNRGWFYKYSPLSKTWWRLADCANIGVDAALCAKGGYIYAGGGWDARTTFKRYNRATNTWTDLTPMPVGRQCFGMDTIFDRIYVYGGCQNWSTPIYSCYSYSPASNSWSYEGDMLYSHMAGAFGGMTMGNPPVGELHAACGFPSHANHEEGLINPPTIKDVGVLAIVAPADTVDSATVVTPACSLYNYGNTIESYTVIMRIGTETKTAAVSSHSPGTGRYVTFSSWTAGTRGTVSVTCSTQLVDDVQTGNDAKRKTVLVRMRDVGVVMILAPSGIVDLGSVIVPACSVHNYGNVTETGYPVRMKIGNYDEIVNTGEHPPSNRLYVTFPSWTALVTGSYVISCSTGLAGDARPANNRRWGSVEVVNPDIGAVAVVAPTGTIPPGTVTPQAKFRNYGVGRYLSRVFFRINSSPPYSDSVILPNGLPPGTDTTVSFRNWNAVFGEYAARCSCWMAQDMNPANNAAGADFGVHLLDVGVAQILFPAGTIDSSLPVVPRVRIRNFGDQPAGFPVRFRIDTAGGNVYSAEETVSNLAGGESLDVTFAPWPKPHLPRHYTTRCTTALVNDANPANDVRTGSFTVRYIDIGIEQIVAPTGYLDTGVTIIPSARFRNLGDEPVSFPAVFRIDSSGITVYSCQSTVSELTPGESRLVSFAEWFKPHPPGSYTTRCSLHYAEDMNPGNNVRSGSFVIYAGGGGGGPDTGWVRLADVPLGPKNKFVKDGGCLTAALGGDESGIYCLKGNNRCEFYLYNIAANIWTTKESVPAFDRTGKKRAVKKGACLTALGTRVYAAKGNNSLEFWEFDPARQGYPWTQLADIPAGNRKVKEGAGMAAVVKGETAFVYLLKGSNTPEFFRYRIGADIWQTMTSAPTGPSGKFFKNGSCITYDRDHTIYALKGSQNEFFAYNVDDNSWTTLSVLPFIGNSGKKKKVKDGAGIAYLNGLVYALKGGNTLEFWSWQNDSPFWRQKPDMPLGGNKKVKGGGALTATDVKVYALKGNNTLEFYSYGPLSAFMNDPVRATNTAGHERAQAQDRVQVMVVPNPFSRTATINYHLPHGGRISLKLYDVTGKLVTVLAEGYYPAGTHRLQIADNRRASGIYLLKFETEAANTTAKLIIE